MPKKYYLLLLLVLITQTAICQVPAENKMLNYRIIAFAAPPEQSTKEYTLEIAAGNYSSVDSFRKHIIIARHCTTEKTIAEVPAFGSQYTWRTIYHTGNSTTKGNLYHFSTGMAPEADTSGTRLRITQYATKKYKDAYVFLDSHKGLYDMEGRLVWYLPPVDGQMLMPTDLKMTSSGTITFLSNNAYEIDYDGNILWKAPNDGKVNGDKEEHYHHDFTKLPNGHYMLLGMEIVKPAPLMETSAAQNKDVVQGGTSTRPSKYTTIIEYDAQGEVVWSWKLSKYMQENGIMNNPAIAPNVATPHTNSFYFDEQEKVIYISCKELNSILKIKYPEGTVMKSYGEAPISHSGPKGDKLFCGQHGVTKSKQDVVFIYNNNDCSEDGLPKVKALKEPITTDEKMKIVWEYQCTTDGADGRKFTSGGDVTVLDDESLFVCMGGDYSKVFIVNKDKKVLWSGLPEKKEPTGWANSHQYRASIIENKEALYKLILGEHSSTVSFTK